MGKILSIDLTEGSLHVESLEEPFARRYLGGNGFAAKFIFDLVPPHAEPLSPENVVVLATGPINATPVWGSGRAHVASISPLTGLFIDSNFGGSFGWMLKRTGYDVIVISGASPFPVVVSITDDAVEIKNAVDLWGKTTSETHALIVEKQGPGLESAVIGPAGENGVAYASVICSGTRISAAGRGGIGAVLGSKNLKAITVRGARNVTIEDPERLKGYLKRLQPDLIQQARGLTDIGTPILVGIINASGRLGTHNNTREVFDQAGAISGEVIARSYKHKNTACHGCPVACGKIVKVPGGEFAHRGVKMPEYETLYALGSMIDNG
ncbi:MAG: aldehyde ferredoxin oxidoreductase N-terminal domain-containing protein, partial [Desulfomonilia bacterium]|nr:aldehyde ferredoxin oxidoreductase N-terminal domain-containing protein [Desulfomonilia bacterium]